MTRTRREWLGALGSIGAVTLAGCTGDGGGGQDTTTTTTTTEQMASGTAVGVQSTDEYGDILVDGDGMALYMFDKDTKGDGASTCYDSCAENWPPLSENNPQASDDVRASLSTFERDDGTMQVAANGWPLYYFASDSSPGDLKGQGVGDVWWLLDPSGKPIKGSGGDDMESPTVQTKTTDEYGDILVDSEGMTLYMFDKDTKGDGASACYDGCADNWPPFVAEDPSAGDDVSAALSTFERDGGDMQVTANGWPLYYFASDESPGDAKGQGVGDVWWVLDPAGTPVTGASDTTTTTTSDGGGDDGDDDDYY